MTSGEGILSSTGFPTPLLITPSGKAAPRRPDPGIRRRIQIGTLRPIRVDHTKCLQVAIKTHSFIQDRADYNNRPPTAVSFMPAIASTAGCSWVGGPR